MVENLHVIITNVEEGSLIFRSILSQSVVKQLNDQEKHLIHIFLIACSFSTYVCMKTQIS